MLQHDDDSGLGETNCGTEIGLSNNSLCQGDPFMGMHNDNHLGFNNDEVYVPDLNLQLNNFSLEDQPTSIVQLLC